jgi:hypothetical protein
MLLLTPVFFDNWNAEMGIGIWSAAWAKSSHNPT